MTSTANSVGMEQPEGVRNEPNTPAVAIDRLREAMVRQPDDMWADVAVLHADLRSLITAYESQAERLRDVEGVLACLDGDREIKPLDGDRLERLLDFEERWACVCPSSDASLSWPDQRALLHEAVLAFRAREARSALQSRPATENGK